MNEAPATAPSPDPTTALPITVSATPTPAKSPRLHYAWVVAGVALVVLLGSAGFRSAPGLMMDALHGEFGWSHATIASASSVNLVLYGLTAPFAAALMDRFGVRLVVV